MGWGIIQCVSVSEARNRARSALIELLEKQKHIARPVLLLLSGGSAFSFLEGIPADMCGPHVTIGMLDERFTKDDAGNNFAQFSRTSFYAYASIVGVSFIDTRVVSEETFKEFSARFAREIRDWKNKYGDGMIITTMGIGADGHTAGIMPFPENPELFQALFDDKQKLVAAYDAGVKNQYPLRITVTLSFLRTYVDEAILYAVGEEKRNALDRIFADDGLLADTPARIIREMKRVHVFNETKNSRG